MVHGKMAQTRIGSGEAPFGGGKDQNGRAKKESQTADRSKGDGRAMKNFNRKAAGRPPSPPSEKGRRWRSGARCESYDRRTTLPSSLFIPFQFCRLPCLVFVFLPGLVSFSLCSVCLVVSCGLHCRHYSLPVCTSLLPHHLLASGELSYRALPYVLLAWLALFCPVLPCPTLPRPDSFGTPYH